MSNIIKALVLSLLLIASTVAGRSAYAEATGNVGVTSNYVWRGIPQSGDDAAISGGLDYAHASGLYVGTWTSSIGGGDQYELDLYAGFAGEVSGFRYDVGATNYVYPLDDDAELDFSEVYGSVGFGPVTASVAYTIGKEADVDDEHDLYLSVAADFDLKEGLSLGLLLGSYDLEDDAAEDITHYRVSLTRSFTDLGDFTFAVDKANDYMDGTTMDEDPRVSVSFTRQFDL